MLESKFINDVLAKAKQHYKTIVLPEGEDLRVLQAAHTINKDKICKIILLGDEAQIKDDFAKNGWDINGIEIINPNTSPKLKEYANMLYEMRKAKGMSEEDALKTALIPNYFGTLMIKAGDADGMVSGANHSTADTVRPALQIIKSASKDRAVSSFLIDCPRPGQPPHYTDEQIIKILEIACRNPEELGYEVSHWSLNLLVDAVIKEGIVDSISAKTVSRFLKYGGNPPPSRPLLASFLRESGFSRDFCGKSE